MAIAFNCPHCLFAYRLKDEFGGKQAKCKNPECRQLITIPKAITIAEDAKLSEAEAEAAALAALADEAAVATETRPTEAEAEAGPAAPAGGKTIAMTCQFCDHKWREPWSKAGKNTLCPNPECRQRVKVPEPKEDVPTDWKQAKSKLPTLAKQNYEKLEGVQDAGDLKMVSGVSLKQADATGEEYEPRPLKQKVMFVMLGVGLLATVVGGIWYFTNRRTAVNEEQLMADAQKELADTRKEWAAVADKKDPKAEWAAADGGLTSAVLNLAAAEYALRFNDTKKTKEAHELLGKAINELRSAAGPARDYVAAELAFATLAFGGTDEEAKDQVRYAWVPTAESARLPRMGEQNRTVHGELRTVLGLLAPADFDLKIAVARRLTRDLAKRGHAGVAADLIPQALFTDPQKNEARAVVALEIHRTDPTSPLPRTIADDLKRQFASGVSGVPHPASAHALFAATGVEKPPQVVTPPPPGGYVVSSDSRFAYTAALLLEGKTAEAVALAQRPPARLWDHQVKALALCADWSADPGPALDAAQAVLSKTPKATGATAHHVVRLAQVAAEKGRHDLAKVFADSLGDAGLKAWAAGEAARLRSAAAPKEKAADSWVEVPESPRDVKAGHAWGRLWVARHNARLSHERDAEKEATKGWPQPVHPFALAGIALGLQDQ